MSICLRIIWLTKSVNLHILVPLFRVKFTLEKNIKSLTKIMKHKQLIEHLFLSQLGKCETKVIFNQSKHEEKKKLRERL